MRTRFLALAVGALATPILAEGAYRWTRAAGLSPTTNPAFVRHDARLGWSYVPGSRARHVDRDFDVEVSINLRGFRGPEWTPANPSRKRLLVLGDSMAFGWGVSWEETFCARLEAEEPRWQVLDAAISGTCTGQQMLLMRDLLAAPGGLAPDAVAVVFCANDLFENGSPRVYGKRKPWFELVGGEPALRGVPVPSSPLERVSQLWGALLKKRWEHDFAQRPRDLDGEWRLETTLLARMRRGLPATIPMWVLSETDELERFCPTQPGLEHLDLRPALARAGGEVRFAHDPHWNALGHQAVASALRARIARLLESATPAAR